MAGVPIASVDAITEKKTFRNGAQFLLALTGAFIAVFEPLQLLTNCVLANKRGRTVVPLFLPGPFSRIATVQKVHLPSELLALSSKSGIPFERTGRV